MFKSLTKKNVKSIRAWKRREEFYFKIQRSTRHRIAQFNQYAKLVVQASTKVLP